MFKKIIATSLPVLVLSGGVLMGGTVAGGVAPVAAQSRNQQQDIGVQIEREYGVLEANTREGRRYNDQFDNVVERIVSAVNARRARNSKEGSQFSLRSAKILGGRDEKHDQIVNAFALPDGRIYVTLGLLRALDNSPRADDELAFVVGHEVSHVTEKHSASQQKEALKAGLLGVLLGAVTRSREAATVAGGLGAAYVSKFSRNDEYEADMAGLLAMNRAGYDPEAAISMLRRLQARGESKNKLTNGWFGSHPLTENRVERIRERIAKLPSGGSRARNADGDYSGFRNRR